MVMWKRGSLRRSGRRRRRRKTRGVGRSAETCSQRSAALLESEASLVSMVFPAVGGKPKLAAELSCTQEFADRLQRPEGEERTTVSDCHFLTVCSRRCLRLKGNCLLLWRGQNCETTFPKASHQRKKFLFVKSKFPFTISGHPVV